MEICVHGWFWYYGHIFILVKHENDINTQNLLEHSQQSS